jgi:DNA-binding Xre family transcriptional regulator
MVANLTMAQSNALIDTLKKALKQHGLTYADLAQHLELSEASVKRMFSTRNFTLRRLDAICQIMRLEISDLLRLLEESKQRITHLTEGQERELVSNPKLLLVAACARNHVSFEEILDQYNLTEVELIGLLAKLDRLRLIELLPKNRIKLVVAADFRWLPGGPVDTFYAKQVENEFFKAQFDNQNEIRLFITGMLSDEAQKTLVRKLNSVAQDFAELHKQDLAQPIDKRTNVGMVLAMRPWRFEAFDRFRRDKG